METKQARMTKNREKAKSETMKKIDLAKKKIDDYFFLGPSIWILLIFWCKKNITNTVR